MARPKKDITRDRWLKFRTNEDERRAIDARRAEAGLSLSDYIRQQAMHGAIIQRKPLADKQLMRSLSAIGNNLNQSARALNELVLSADAIGDPKLADRLRATLSEISPAASTVTDLIDGMTYDT